jgi:hypothetical protein
MTLNIQHASDVARVQSNAENVNARPEVAQQMFADRLEKEVRQNEQQVVQSNKSEKNEVNPEGRGHGGGHKSKRKATQKKDEPKKATARAGSGSLFDVSV